MKKIMAFLNHPIVNNVVWSLGCFVLSIFLTYRISILFPVYFNLTEFSSEMEFGIAVVFACMFAFCGMYFAVSALWKAIRYCFIK